MRIGSAASWPASSTTIAVMSFVSEAIGAGVSPILAQQHLARLLVHHEHVRRAQAQVGVRRGAGQHEAAW